MKYLKSRFCDFQIHSPRDRLYKGWPSKLMTLDGLYKWADKLLQECRARNITAIAVTDHHDLLPSLVLLETAHTKGFDDIWVFPGMEITSKSGIQAILLLDPSIVINGTVIKAKDTEHIQNKVLTAIGQAITAKSQPATELKAASWKDLEKLEQMDPELREDIFKAPKTERVDRELDGDNGIADHFERFYQDKFVLLPNLEKNKHGVFDNEAGRALYLKAGGWFVGGIVGGQNDTDHDAINGKKIQDFGPRIVTCLRTSDQRGKDETSWFSNYFGKAERGSWIKLSESTTTSLTQALISGYGKRVFEVRQNEPGDRIERFWIEGAAIVGTSKLNIEFTPHLNTFIGGRGSGKSILLSALVRLFGVDREWITKIDDNLELSSWEKRHLSLFDEDGPFAGSNVVFGVEYTKEPDVRYRLTVFSPDYGTDNHCKLEIFDGKSWSLLSESNTLPEELDLQPLFFLQGQMSTLTGDNMDQQDLTRLIEGPIREQRANLRAKLEKLAVTVKEGYENSIRLRSLRKGYSSIETQIKQKDEERKSYLAIAQSGLSEEEQQLFESGEPLQKGKQAAQDIEEKLDEFLADLNDQIEELEDVIHSAKKDLTNLGEIKVEDFSKEEYLKKLTATARKLVSTIKLAKDKGRNELEEAIKHKKRFTDKINRLTKKANTHAEKERHRKEALNKSTELQKIITALNKQNKSTEKEIKRIEKSGLVESGKNALDEYKTAVVEYSNQLTERATIVSNDNDLRLIVKITPGGIFDEFIKEMRTVCAGAGIREAVWRQFEDTLREDGKPAEIITDIIQSVIKCFENPENVKHPAIWNKCGFSKKIFGNIIEMTTIEQWIQLSVVLAEDRVDVKYKIGDSKKPIPILQASPGERAVELLNLALKSTKGPLIIDQPEDDLDNHFLAENLVELVHQAKSNNQLIFTSHNANIVVHGDSDIIHVMEPVDQVGDSCKCRRKDCGTIDQKNICLDVEQIMEGGRKAFEDRRRKYHETIDPEREEGSIIS